MEGRWRRHGRLWARGRDGIKAASAGKEPPSCRRASNELFLENSLSLSRSLALSPLRVGEAPRDCAPETESSRSLLSSPRPASASSANSRVCAGGQAGQFALGELREPQRPTERLRILRVVFESVVSGEVTIESVLESRVTRARVRWNCPKSESDWKRTVVPEMQIAPVC